MNEVTCLDTSTGNVFTKTFNDIDKQRKFINKCKHSNTLVVIDYTCENQEELEYISR